MKDLLSNELYSFVNQSDKDFIVDFNKSMTKAGYDNNGIQPYVVFGKYKIEYYKPGSKTKKYIARIYFRDEEIVLRLYFSDINKQRSYLENTPEFIKEPFVSDYHNCKMPNCKGMITKGKCRYQKTYTLDGINHIKCAEQSFMYFDMQLKYISQFIDLILTFYPVKKRS